MTDDLDKLKQALGAATPAPDPAKRAANLRLAEENFDRLQGSAREARPTPKRAPTARLFEGVGKMLNTWTTKGALVGSTAVAAMAMIWIGGNFSQNPGDGFALNPNAPTVVSSDEAITEPLVDSEIARREAPAEALQGAPLAESAASPAPAPAQTEEAFISGDFGSVVMGDADDAVDFEQLSRLRVAPEDTYTSTPFGEVPRVSEENTETFANADANPVKVTAEAPVSTFSIDVDTASYSVIRQSIQNGMLPPKDAVRVEEMINYFDYSYPAPDGTHPFQPTVTVAETPWNAGTEIVHIGLQGVTPAVEDRPPLNLVFLIDTSGSMQDSNKLPLLKQSFRLMLSELRPEDQVAIVTYAGSAGQVLDPTPAGERSTILAALDRLEAGGSTAGQAGLQQAYATAEAMADEGDVTRVILATDGDFNVGLSDPTALEDFIAEKKESGTYLSVLGFGRGNLDDTTMQALAQNGNGTAAYIDTLSEARKVLVDQLTGALFPIADDVKIQLEFNPSVVAEYRLIGYETRALAREDFNNDAVDAGEIGAGRQVTAIYEIARVGSEGVRNDPLRYSAEAQVSVSAEELGFLKLRYKNPGEETSTLIETPIPAVPPTEITGDVAFATAIAGFGQLLRGSDLLDGWTYADAIQLANTSKGDDPFGYRAEAIDLMRLADALSR
ncbi:MAG: VWA domain-containing protein [Pseudomonadota bacterium]